jgi:bifunctional UDP-N-acetylglucosamine pyrophosphorylase/glucosamine-1-phosphate N-acetyltransferase
VPRPLKTAWLCLGSNLGNPGEQLNSACERLEKNGVEIALRSSVKDTKPWGKTDQPDFVNQVLKVKTSMGPFELLSLIHEIENEMGRVRTELWGPRVIDIDILFYEDTIMETPQLTLPHPYLHLRRFCLELLCEVEPDLVHPVLKQTMKELNEALKKEEGLKNLSAIILAAGKGSRMKSNKAKVTFPLAGKSMVQRVVDTALKVDCSKIAVIVGFQKQSVIDCISPDERLEYVEQTEQLGTGHAVMCAKDAFEGLDTDVLILCGDVPLLSTETLKHLVKVHRESGASCTLLTAFLDDAGRYGRILRDADGHISGIVEYKDATDEQRAIKEWNTGIYCFNSRDMFDALSKVSNTNEQNEFYLTDTLALLRAAGKKVSSIVLENLNEVTGVNSQAQLAQLEDDFIAQLRETWMQEGVLMHLPATVYIEDEVVLESDVEIGPGCVIKGKSVIGSGTKIGPTCLIENSRIGAGSELKGQNILINAKLEPGSSVGYAKRIIND